MKRHGHPRPAALAEHVGHHVEQVAVGHHVRAADLDLAAGRLGPLARLGQVLEHVGHGDRLGAVAQPGGRDHRRQALHEIAERPVGLALRADHHRRAEVGERRAPRWRARARSRRGSAGAPSAARRARRGTPRAPRPRRAPSGRTRGRPALALGEALAGRRRGPSSARGSRPRPCRHRRPAGWTASSTSPSWSSKPGGVEVRRPPAVAHEAAHLVPALARASARARRPRSRWPRSRARARQARPAMWSSLRMGRDTCRIGPEVIPAGYAGGLRFIHEGGPLRQLPPPARGPQHPRERLLHVRARQVRRALPQVSAPAGGALPGLRAGAARPASR